VNNRTIVGRLWLELVVKHYLACRDADNARQAKLFDLLDSFADEFPADVQAEVDSYIKAAGENATEAQPPSGTPTPAEPSKAVNGFSQARKRGV
jgi:hypothetical protein